MPEAAEELWSRARADAESVLRRAENAAPVWSLVSRP